ncbi:MAG: OprO/OprP family phosphate-selective porin, partial [Gammaproteobacteria bacterium]|nr:OprO/OprP family phosphate-selective porin [Gammaproteobacteria bacterium]
VGAGRDVGVQLFDAFQMGAWEHSYSVMYGNGNGLNYTDNDENKDLYLYISSEKVFDGSGPRRNGMKFFIWSIDGKRTVDDDGTTGVISNKEFDRKRAGAGFKLVSQSLHMTVEYITAEGMIWLGPHKDNFDMNALGGAGDGRVGKADARYIEAGYRLPGMKWELDLRYDEYHRLTNGPANLQVNYTTTTLGAQYHFNKKSRFTFNYEDRAAETASANASLYGHLSTLGPRISAQITHIF